jgi:hypothetical protein
VGHNQMYVDPNIIATAAMNTTLDYLEEIGHY